MVIDGCLEFEDDRVLDEDVGEVFTHHLSIIVNADGILRFRLQAILPKLMDQGVLVHLFQEACSQRIGYLERTPNDLLRQGIPLFLFHTFPHRCSSVFICGYFTTPNVHQPLPGASTLHFFTCRS